MIKEIKVYQNLIDELTNLGVNLYPTNYGFVRYFPPLNELPKVKNNIDREISFKSIEGKLALFFYIPFCAGHCSYCFYLKKINAPAERVDEYLKYLEKEAEIFSEKIKGYKINSVYIGGGTLTYLNTDQLRQLFRILNEYFSITTDSSFTFEASPETLSKEKIDVLLKNGVKRISMGVQSLDDKILAGIKRRYTSKEVVEKIMLLKENATSFNLDFIYGLENQTIGDIVKYLKLIKEIQPPSITFYQKWFFMKDKFKNGNSRIKKSESLFRLIEKKELIAKTMDGLGYLQDGLYRYVKKPKDGCVYCKTVWEDNSCLALGLSAYSYINGISFQNVKDFTEYSEIIAAKYTAHREKKSFNSRRTSNQSVYYGIKSDQCKRLWR